MKGRILNSVNKGYCVGIAGLTAFLPYSLCTLLTASKVGVLQPFIIQRLNPETLSVVVADPQMVAQQKARAEHRLKRQAERSEVASCLVANCCTETFMTAFNSLQIRFFPASCTRDVRVIVQDKVAWSGFE